MKVMGLVILGVIISLVAGCSLSPYDAGYRNCQQLKTTEACEGYIAYDANGKHHPITKFNPAYIGNNYWGDVPNHGDAYITRDGQVWSEE
jgi:hypothetical protein